MQKKFLKFFTLLILIFSSFFLGKHLIINAQTGSNSVRVNCSPASLCSNVTARVFVPQGGCPSGDEECGKNNYKQDKPIPAGSTTVTLTDIPDGVYTVILIKDGHVTTPPKIEVSLSGGTTSTATFVLSVDTSKIKSFTATPKGIESGGSSTLAWQTEGLNNCSLSNGIGTIPNNGQKIVKPTITTTYILSCFNSVGIRKTAAATVTIMGGGGGGGTDPALTLSSNTVKRGESIKVIWSNIPDPTKYDVIGFFNDPNAWADWSKVNGSGYAGACTKNVMDGSVNGSCSFLIPASTEPGTYKFRYRHFDQASDSYSTVVNSINFTVTSGSGGGGGGTGGGGGGGGTGGGTGGTGGTSCSETNLVPKKVDIYKNKPAIFANGYSRALTMSGTGSNRKLTINQDFGFTAFSLANPNDPTIIQHKNMTTNGNPPGGPFSKTGDGQSVVQGLSASLDGSRMLVGWSDDPDDFIVLKDFNGSWEVQAEGDGTTNRPWGMSIVKRSDGKYIGFEYNGGSLYAADVSDPLPTAHYDYPDGGGRSAAPVFNTYRVPNTSFDPNTPTMQLSGLQQAGNYVAYPGDLDRTSATTARNGNAIILVDASKPLGNPNIASNFTVKRLSMSVLGIPTGLDNNGFLTATINSFTMTASQSDPDTIYLFVETTKSSAPGPIYVYKISSSGSVIKPVTGSPVNPPAPFTGTGSQNDRGRPFAYTTSDKSRAFFVRQTSSLVGFVNVTVKDSAVSVNVATAPYSISTTAELSGMQGFEENNTAYIYTAHGSFMNAWKINCNTASTSPSVKIDSFTATPPIIKNGESSKLTWQTTSTFPTNVGRNYVTLNGEPVGEDGERTVEPNRTTNYILKISRSEDSGAASADSCTAKAERFDDSSNRPRIFASGYLNYLSLYGNAVKKLMIGQNFGYTVASLINPASPVVAGHDNMITAGGGGPIEKAGDGQSTVMELATSPDGQRALVGWTDSPHDVFVLSPNGDIFKVVAHFGSYRPTGVGIVQRSDGKYFGFELQYQYLFVADITSLPSEEMTTSEVSELKNKIEEEAINHPTSGTNGFARTAGHFFGYKKDGEALGIVYAGAPYSGGSIANILKTFTVTPRDLGVGAYTINNFTLVSTPNNPDIAYIFADLAGGLKGGPMAVATINSSGVVKPLAGSPITVPAPFTTGQLEFNSIAGFYNGSEPQATIIRGTVDSWGFINIKASSNNLSISVATLPKADFNSSRDIAGWGNGKNTYIYTAQSTKVSAVTITCNNTGGPTPPSGTCTAPNCASAMRVVTVGNDGGGGTGTGGEDDGTGRRSWFWWLKYYLNL